MTPLPEAVALLVFTGVAAVGDVRRLRIPNKLVVAGIAVAVLFALYDRGTGGLLHAAAGLAVGVLVLMPFHLLKMMGAGDVKLMGMVGAFLGPVDGFCATLATMLAGGAVSVWWLWRMRRNHKESPQGGGQAVDTREMRMPYGVAIFLGTLAWLVIRWAWLQ